MRSVKPTLVEVVRARQVIAYSDLAVRIRAISFLPSDQRFFFLLREISADEYRAGRGMLTAVVVHRAGDYKPGLGFFELARVSASTYAIPTGFGSNNSRQRTITGVHKQAHDTPAAQGGALNGEIERPWASSDGFSSFSAQIDRYFNEKVDFLASLPDKLDPAIRAPLKHLHQYRNQAYHRGQVRPATAIACRLLVEINCELLLSLGWVESSYASDEDYSWIEKRFGLSAVQMLGDRAFLQRAAEEMRRRVFVDSSALSVALSDHLEARITDLRNALAFVLEHTQCFRSPSEVFRASQYRSAVNFSVLETALEPFEDDVHSLASEVDRAIQWAVDIARGK